MGVRIALGTTPWRLRGVLVRQGMITVATGAIPGVAGAIFCGRFLESLIDGAKSVSIGTCAGAILIIAAFGAAGIWTATRRIDRFDIMEIRRSE